MKRISLVFASVMFFLLVSLLSPSASAQTACAPPWQIGISITTGEVLSFNGDNWQARQPEVQTVDGWQPPNVPALWTDLGACSSGGNACSAAPGAPTGLSSANVTSTSAMLSWTAVTPPANCTVTSYTVFENGTSIGSTTNTSFPVSGLSAATTFSFTVAATDSFATGGQSPSLAVTTLPATGGGGTCFPAWSAATTYHGGDQVSLGGINFTAAFFSQNQSPAANNGPAGSGEPWISDGPCTTCSTLAGAPGLPSASGTTFNSTGLTWPAVTPPANCTITGYTVLENGTAIGTASTNSFTVHGLKPQTAFNFTVEANDGAGSSPQSPAVSVTTQPCPSGQTCTSNVFFATYKDVTVSADFNNGQQRSNVTGTVQPVTSAMPNKTLIWSFATGTCDAENWAGFTPAQEQANIQQFTNTGKNYIISTGGAAGTFDCSSGQGLINFINRYNSPNLVGVDFDIEGSQSQQVVDNLITATIAAEKQFPNLLFSFTIPSFGSLQANPITGPGVATTVVKEIQRLNLGGNFVINLLTFDYGIVSPTVCVVVNNQCQMGQSAIAAVQALNQQTGIPMSHIGFTQDIGQADTQGEVTTLQDIDTLNAFAVSNGLPISWFFSFDRDTPNGTSADNMNGNGAPPLAYNQEYIKTLNTQ
ncbi:MAG TPA: fibronectin type III domain-containing protein [Candidatus Angelobacter sp.]|nr:fibronectin type III domain-containing protein [Candidatus Angelobacter sp.]